jgi:hypothetical protein
MEASGKRLPVTAARIDLAADVGRIYFGSVRFLRARDGRFEVTPERFAGLVGTVT